MHRNRLKVEDNLKKNHFPNEQKISIKKRYILAYGLTVLAYVSYSVSISKLRLMPFVKQANGFCVLHYSKVGTRNKPTINVDYNAIQQNKIKID